MYPAGILHVSCMYFDVSRATVEDRHVPADKGPQTHNALLAMTNHRSPIAKGGAACYFITARSNKNPKVVDWHSSYGMAHTA